MKPDEVERLLDNEREWRRYLIDEIRRMNKDISSLKSRVAAVSALIGSGFSILIQWVKVKFGGSV